MSALTLDRDAIYDRVIKEAREAKIDIPGVSLDAVRFITDVILEEMKIQYLTATRV